MEKVSIKGMDKAAVLAALYNASKQQGMGFIHARGRSGMTLEQASEELKQFKEGEEIYFDYLHGRVMKVDLSKDELYPWGYDRDNGEGAALRAIKGIVTTITEASS